MSAEKNSAFDNEASAEKISVQPVSKLRRALPQVLATTAKNLILLDLGMTLAFPTLVIPALLNSKQELNFDHNQASWFGSIAFICQPIGSIISGTVLEPLGRKKSMLLVNVPHLIGWCLFSYGTSVPLLFSAAIMMGLGVGFMEAPVITYVGEISEPKLRGVLTAYSGIFVSVGLIVEFLLGTLYSWSTAALISSIVPVITIIAISQVPETPMWLLSKGRIKEAEKALCWLRGWVPAELVQKELNELIRYSDASKLILTEKPRMDKKSDHEENGKRKPSGTYSNPVDTTDELPPSYEHCEIERNVTCSSESKQQNHVRKNVSGSNTDNKTKNVSDENAESAFETISLPDNSNIEQQLSSTRKPTIKELIQDMTRPQMLRPLSLVVAFFVFHNGSGFPALRPYMVKVFNELKFPVDAHWATVVVSTIGFVGMIISTICVPYAGKRILTLVSLAGCAFSILSLGTWSYLNKNIPAEMTYWTPFILFIFYSFSFSFGIAPIPWMLLSEVFPFRGRGFASGIAAAISYIMGFITSKTFLDLEMLFGLPGVFYLYGSITLIGIVYIYFKLPETEGRSLEDIENSYNKKIKEKN